ncbi:MULTISPECIES: hypothetical protein [unclassified Streptomyces]|nr:hypothetical protein [Streptomyces sp. HSG2]
MPPPTTVNLAAARLKGDFDVDRLLSELAVLEETQWESQRTYG